MQEDTHRPLQNFNSPIYTVVSGIYFREATIQGHVKFTMYLAYYNFSVCQWHMFVDSAITTTITAL